MSTTLKILRQRLQTSLGDISLVYASYYIDAINDAIREIFPILSRPVLNDTLITGNSLPNSHFEDWALSTVPDKYALSVVTAVKDTDNTYLWSGKAAAKVTRAGSDGYLYISDVEWPRLLDLQGKTISFKARAYASQASQARLTIYTNKADGTTQTESSSYHSGGGNYELLSISDLSINSDITDIEFRFEVKTTDGNVWYDNACVPGHHRAEYLLPSEFDNGSVLEVYLQAIGYLDDWYDDIHTESWQQVYGYRVLDDSVDKLLALPSFFSASRKIRLIGYTELSTLDVDEDTTELDNDRDVSLLIACAKYKLYQMVEGPISSQDIGLYERASAKAYQEYMRLKARSGKARTSTMNLRVY